MKAIAKILIVVAALGGGLLLSGFTTGDNNAAGINKDFACAVFDGNGYLVLGNGSISVVNHGGNTNLICKATGVATPGYEVEFWGFGCNTFGGFTTNSYNVVSEDGNVTLRCQIKK